MVLRIKARKTFNPKNKLKIYKRNKETKRNKESS